MVTKHLSEIYYVKNYSELKIEIYLKSDKKSAVLLIEKIKQFLSILLNLSNWSKTFPKFYLAYKIAQ
jgi:hypothetical protein